MIANTEVLIRSIRHEAEGVLALELALPKGGLVDEWTPGAHLDVILPSGTVRQYSLCSDPADLSSYRVAVLREREGRGGSEEIHTQLRVGQTLRVQGLRNHFKLDEDAQNYLLVAGGIGITPILSMARKLKARGKNVTVIYSGASRKTMAFVEELQAVAVDVKLFPKDETGRADLRALVSQAPKGTHVYACGPKALLEELEAITTEILGADSYHQEHFNATVSKEALEGDRASFEVELTKTGTTLTVTEEQSILDAVLEVNSSFMSSCEEGFCGTCEVKVLAGEVDHRDTILSAKERAKNDTMFICVSRAKCSKLVIEA
ncbi:PDR/VanB family oxidoreductase [Glutamicibacter mysorens]|uniref:PDR/VanB family oxidoreductase n=1 Tax=Glutamicibacter mysorens TaxID=257984 RepID=UPI0020C6CB51|nr:PDR/VanB family oxidoreductase [Glutamicibacter mysorens]UTM45736.1 PDR/VanB family oxidoreductase [Glutamicibacter mysorens]